MEPTMGQSIVWNAKWSLGSMYYCEHYNLDEALPSDVVTSWQEDTATLCLRPHLFPPTMPPQGWTGSSEDCSAPGQFGDSHIYALGPDSFVKVKRWVEGQQTEGGTIHFINKHFPWIPTTQVIHHWVDRAWRRSYMIMRKVSGSSLDEVWPLLTEKQRKRVAEAVAKHIADISLAKSDRLHTVDGSGVTDDSCFLELRQPEDEATTQDWESAIHPQYNMQELEDAMLKASDLIAFPPSQPNMSEFCLYNCSMNSSNIFVEVGRATAERPDPYIRITGLIDWACTAYYPRWFVATAPHPRSWRWDADWASSLQTALLKHGFISHPTWYMWYLDGVDDQRHRKMESSVYLEHLAEESEVLTEWTDAVWNKKIDRRLEEISRRSKMLPKKDRIGAQVQPRSYDRQERLAGKRLG